jgi:hypothetical protein
MKSLNQNDRVYSEVHGAWVRFVRWEGEFAAVADSDTGRELPDLVHRTQLR